MAAVIYSRRQVGGFVALIAFVLVLLAALPTPAVVERRTGAAVEGDLERLARAQASGNVARALAVLCETDGGRRPSLLAGLVERLRRELEPLALEPTEPAPVDSDDVARHLLAATGLREGASLERLFVEASGAEHAIDARAGGLSRRIERGEVVAVGTLLELADAYERDGRDRARWRWLARAYAQAPNDDDVLARVLPELVAQGLLDDAVVVARSCAERRADDEPHQRLLARLGAWTGRTSIEIAALERLVARSGAATDRTRLVDLYAFVGALEKALPHAMALATDAAAVSEAESAADAALQAGFVDEGLELLTRAAAHMGDPQPWLERLARHALSDLRVDRAALELERVAAFDPDGALPQLEALYRRTDQPERLVAVLQRRLGRDPTDEARWREVIALRHALGQPGLAGVLEQQRALALADPEAFRGQLPPELQLAAHDAQRNAVAMSLVGAADGPTLVEVLDRLRPFLQLPEFRRTAELLLAQHAEDPAARRMRVELLDLHRTPAEATVAAADLCADRPDDVELVRLWIERAGWASLPEAEITARRRLAALAPDDRDNRYALADLCAFVEDRDAAIDLWRELYEESGPSSPAAGLLVDGLFAAGRDAEGLDVLERMAKAPDATVALCVRAADELYYRRDYRRAAPLYRAALARDPSHPAVLLHLGNLHAWSGEPARAKPLLERRLQLCGRDDPEFVRVCFRLGEVLWALGDESSARSMHARLLDELQRAAAHDLEAKGMVAVALERLGRIDEALDVWRERVAAEPRNAELLLDYADLLLVAGRIEVLDAVLRQVEAIEPHGPRLLALRGAAARSTGRLDEAERLYATALERDERDLAAAMALAEVRTELGDWSGALDAYDRWLQLERLDRAAQHGRAALQDVLSPTAVGSVRSLRVGSDRVLESTVGGTFALDDGLRLDARVGHGRYRGTSATSTPLVSTETALFDLTLERHVSPNERYGFGLRTAPGAPGDLPVGGFASLQRSGSAPFRSLELRLGVHELWTEPAAAPALGGRRSSLQLELYSEFATGWWTGVTAAVDRLDLDRGAGAGIGDWRARGELSFGRRLLGGSRAVAAPFAVDRVPAGPTSPFVRPRADADESAWLGSTWLSLQSQRLFDGDELPSVLPIAKVDDHLLLAGRIDRRFGDTFGCSVGANVGVDLDGDGSIWGVDVGVTWRPRRWCELTLLAGRGAALGRSAQDEVEQFRLEGVLRW